MKKQVECLLIGYYGDGINFEKIKSQQSLISPIEFTSSYYAHAMQEVAITGTYLHSLGQEIRYAVSFLDEREQIKTYLREENVLCAAVITRYFRNLSEYKEITRFIKEQSPHTKVVIGGAFLYFALQKCQPKEREVWLQSSGADSFIEQFDCTNELAALLRCWRAKTLVVNDRKKAEEKAVEILSSDQRCTEFLPTDWEYFQRGIKQVTCLRTNISCPFHCSFCSVKNQTDQFRVIPRETVMAEWRALKRVGKTQIVVFSDETLNLPRKDFTDLLQRIITDGSHFPWCSFVRSEYIDEKTATLMRRSGCRAVLLGLESGNDGQLEKMNKQVKVKQLKEHHKILRQQGIMTFAFFIVGFPSENSDTVADTIAFINEIQPTFYKIHKWKCEVNTTVWNQRERYALTCVNNKWKHSSMDEAQADKAIQRIHQAVSGSIHIKHMDFTYILQLLLAGVSLGRIQEYLSIL